VNDAIEETAAALVAEHGAAAVTMSRIAEETGIGRATLYKYFPDVDAILAAWHEHQLSGHLAELAAALDQARGPGERLQVALETYARFQHARRDSPLVVLLHERGRSRARHHLTDFLTGLLREAAAAGAVRDDVPPEELVRYCLDALSAASSLPSKPAVARLVTVVLAGLRYRAS
jgi:AcrR family transcriptional regulator